MCPALHVESLSDVWKVHMLLSDCSKSVSVEVTCFGVCQVMGWVNQYHDTLRDLGIEEDELGFPVGSERGIGMLTDKYIDRMHQQLNAWCTNILQVPSQQLVACACLLPLRVRNGAALTLPPR